MNTFYVPAHNEVSDLCIVLAMQTATRFSIKYICFTRKPPFVEKKQRTDLRPA